MGTIAFQVIMDGLEFRKRGREMVDYIVDYLDNIDARRVTPNIEPGYLQDLIPPEPPSDPEDWDNIMDDIEKKIMIGVEDIVLSAIIELIITQPFITDDALAASAISCVFSGGKFLPFHLGRYAGRCHWMCGIFLG